jgi:hypothetical protein
LSAFIQDALKSSEDARRAQPQGIIGDPDEAVSERVAMAISQLHAPSTPRFAEGDGTGGVDGADGTDSADGNSLAAEPDPALAARLAESSGTPPLAAAATGAEGTSTRSAPAGEGKPQSGTALVRRPSRAHAAAAPAESAHGHRYRRGPVLAVSAAAAVLLGCGVMAMVVGGGSTPSANTAQSGSGTTIAPLLPAGAGSSPSAAGTLGAPGNASKSASGGGKSGAAIRTGTSSDVSRSAGSGAMAASAPVTTFSGIAGYGCSNSTAASFTGVGFTGGGSDDWDVVAGDDGTGSGCSNGFLAMPMSGTAGQDGANRGLWAFDDAASSSVTCSVRVYIPLPHSASGDYEVGGTAAVYGVFDGTSTADAVQVGQFTVDQAAHRGGSVLETGFAVDQPLLVVRLYDRGVDYTSTPNLMYGVAAIRATCTRG